MLSESVTQFQAQAYRELLPESGPVRVQVMGQETPELAVQAERVKNYMNYEITCTMEEFDPELDQMLFTFQLLAQHLKIYLIRYYKEPLVSLSMLKI